MAPLVNECAATAGEIAVLEPPVASEAPVVLEARGLTAAYEGKEVLHGVDLAVRAGRVTAVIGPSGCGKSTLLRALNGLLSEEEGARVAGQVLLGGQDCARMRPEELRRRVGMVFQTPAPFPFSVGRNIEYVLKYHGMRRRADLDAAVERHLRAVGLWDEVKDDLRKSALKLSGGQQQRLCIARALAAGPEVLLLDEPCSALDVQSTAVVEETLARLKESLAVVVVTHNIAQARRIADDVVFLYEGAVVESGPAAQVLDEPREERTREFLAGTFG